MSTNIKIIITGGPGTGKTTLIDKLRQLGYSCYPEMARQLIQEQLVLGSDLFPWSNVKGYSDLLFGRICAQVREANTPGIQFFDRSAVDVLGYLQLAGYPIDAEKAKAIGELGYCNVVFYLPFWEMIYRTDRERRETIEEAKQVSKQIADTYLTFGFTLVEVPKVTPDERADFILTQIAQFI